MDPVADPERIRNEQVSLFNAVSADCECVARLDGEDCKLGCVISAAETLSGSQRHRGATSWPGLEPRDPDIGAMAGAMQATPPTSNGQRWSRFRPRSRWNTRRGAHRTAPAAAGHPRADAPDQPARCRQRDPLYRRIRLPMAPAAQGFPALFDGTSAILSNRFQFRRPFRIQSRPLNGRDPSTGAGQGLSPSCLGGTRVRSAAP